MLQVVWEYHLKSGAAAEFERHYAAEGTWAALFRRSPAYHGTMLLRDRANPLRYLTVDTWEDSSSLERFKETFREDYEKLDQECAKLTEVERCVGWFDTAD